MAIPLPAAAEHDAALSLALDNGFSTGVNPGGIVDACIVVTIERAAIHGQAPSPAFRLGANPAHQGFQVNFREQPIRHDDPGLIVWEQRYGHTSTYICSSFDPVISYQQIASDTNSTAM